MIVGTSYFTNLRAAYDYYKPQGFNMLAIQEKLRTKEIYIGRPPLKSNERLVMLDDNKRYGIADDGPLSPRQRWGIC